MGIGSSCTFSRTPRRFQRFTDLDRPPRRDPTKKTCFDCAPSRVFTFLTSPEVALPHAFWMYGHSASCYVICGCGVFQGVIPIFLYGLTSYAVLLMSYLLRYLSP
jgi:hypothetical protein